MSTYNPVEASILVVGGYGMVGKQLAELLAERNPALHLLIAGRQLHAAQEVARGLPRADGWRIDLDDADPLDRLPADGVDLVVCAANDGGDRLLRACVARGIALVDITRWTARVRDGLRLLPAMGHVRAPVVFASSWMASVPATLAAHHARRLASVSGIDIDILYALADRAGPNSTEYMDRLAEPYEATVDGRHVLRRPFSKSRAVHFDGESKARTWLFDTPDQMTLPAIADAGTVTARIAFDDPWVTAMLAALVRSGIWRAISGPRFTGLRRRLLYNPGDGDRHRVLVSLQGRDANGDEAGCRIVIDDPAGQTHLTAVGAVIQAERVLGLHGHEPAAPTVQYAEAASDGERVRETLAGSGVTLAMERLPAVSPADPAVP